MTIPMLQELAAGRLEAAAELGGFKIERPIAVPTWVLRDRIRMIERDSEQALWLLRAVVLADGNTVIGDVGFHHKPGDPAVTDHAPRGVELGYSIDPPFRRHGYASEAIAGMMAWARATANVSDFFLSVSPDNAASLALAARMGFVQVGTREDERDGTEHVLQYRNP